MKVLLTGGRGFIGSRVGPLLQSAGHVVTPFPGDLRDPGAFPSVQFDAVFHLASLITHRGDYSADDFRAVNLEGTRRLLSTYSDAHFVYVSTIDVTRPVLSEYAKSKLEAEREVQRHSSYAIVRLPSIFGPGQKQQSKLIPRLVRHYILGEPKPELTDDARPCLYVDDAAAAVCAGLQQTGIMNVPATVVHNRDLDRYIRMASMGNINEPVETAHARIFEGLSSYAREVRLQGQVPP
jgi:nucleoside-diphosphate-sugar epimerase